MNSFFISALLSVAVFSSATAVNYNQCGQFWNRDTPGMNGDFEIRSHIRTPTTYCEDPVAFEAATVDGVPYTATGEILVANLSYGLHCENRVQPDRTCLDYKIRWCCLLTKPECPKGNAWTQYFNMDGPSGDGDFELTENLRKHHTICPYPSGVDVRDRATGSDYRRYRQVVGVSATRGAWCVNAHQRVGDTCRDYQVRFCCPRVRG